MADREDLLFELGCEELPPKSLLRLRDALSDNVSQLLAQNNLGFDSVRGFATPRRLALLISGLQSTQPDVSRARKGPAISAAFDQDGKPTKAAEGFARSCGTTVDQLGRKSSEQGEWLLFEEVVAGERCEALIPGIINDSLARLPIARRMRWGSGTTEFVRPVHWSLLIYGAQVIRTDILGTHSADLTYGHRFHAPDPIKIEQPAQYGKVLYEQGRVIADFEQRRTTIREQVNALASETGAIPLLEDELLDEITALVEWPVAFKGDFDSRFLQLPAEVLITTMRVNQKYFPLNDRSGALCSAFIAVSNIESSDMETVRKGNEKVIRPRLADAEFFWNQDRKTPLADRLSSLKDVVFQEKLGTLADKSQRVVQITQYIAGQLELDAKPAMRAAMLAKADLVTDMVGEFPSLQGVMGRYYAAANGEGEEIARAIEEHYLPKQSGGPLADSMTGQIVSIAEKVDSMAGIFSIGMIPTGEKDPYGLRRCALGILRVLIEKELDLDLNQLVTMALDTLPQSIRRDGTEAELLDFIHERLRGYCLDRGFKTDEFEAVLAVGPARPLDFEKRLKAVSEFRSLDAAASLAAANKRIRNILRKTEVEFSEKVDSQQFRETQEKDLYEALTAADEAVAPLLASHDYRNALMRLADLREEVDLFFDEVMVMAEEPLVRNNRLALLSGIQNLFLQIADISKLQ